MRVRTRLLLLLVPLLPACTSAAPASAPPSLDAPPELAGTSWQLIRFEGGDDTILTPDGPAKYTLAFGTDGRVAVRVDCNRGSATWKASDSSLELGPLALTRAACPPGSLHDHIVRQWPFIRSYVVRGGHLFLSLMADGGIYELAPFEDP
jgi:para-nitrobenzyl esterase